MKINYFRCPSCGAELIVEEGKRSTYCSYCQKNVPVVGATKPNTSTGSQSGGSSYRVNSVNGSYKVNSVNDSYRVNSVNGSYKANHADGSYRANGSKASYNLNGNTDRTGSYSDETIKIRSLEELDRKGLKTGKKTDRKAVVRTSLSYSGQKKKQGLGFSDRLLVFLVIVAAVMGGMAALFFSDAPKERKEEKLRQSFESQISKACERHGANLKKLQYAENEQFNEEDGVYKAEIVTKTDQKKDIDSLQEDILETVTIEEGQGISILYLHPDYVPVRRVSIRDNGYIYTHYDSSVEEVETAAKSDAVDKKGESENYDPEEDFQEKMVPVLEGTPFTLEDVDYSLKELFITMSSETREKEQVDDMIGNIKEVLRTLAHMDGYVIIFDEDGDILREERLDLWFPATVKDTSNTTDDEETDRIEKEYRDAIEARIPETEAVLEKLKIQSDEVYICMRIPQDSKMDVKTIRDALKSILYKCTPMPLHVTVNSLNFDEKSVTFDIQESEK